MPSYINGHEFDVSQVSVQPQKQVGRGKSALLNYAGKPPGKLFIDTPIMRMPFGVSPPNPSKNINDYSCAVSFDGMEKNPKIRAFYDAMVALDNYALDVAVQNSKAWFNKVCTRQQLIDGDKYFSIVKEGKDGHAPTMKFKVRSICKEYTTSADGKRIPDETSGKKLEAVIYTHTGDLVDYGDEEGILEAVPRGSVGTVRAAIGGFWFSTVGFGISFQMTVARVKTPDRVAAPPPISEDEFNAAADDLGSGDAPTTLDADNDDTPAPLPKVVAPAVAPRKSPPRVAAHPRVAAPPVEEEDAPFVEDEIIVEEPVPAPAPPPKKVVPTKGVSKGVKKTN